ncbi:probable 39S ribosomal protein L23, mitochondrial [Diaphorina citri]|uniref:Large ribosomal subunit protein uL23m n=1 Tax=Diaphorina citri TaxID=121845 RepID=A0A3Q0IV06_DIACI|nr:probable 39S ribosomal protein L23, mitochondrial [Diaphorina citri]
MSSRWYPIYQKGNPQLRIFLPNFWMKLVRSKEPLPPNVVEFHVPLAMTNHDIKNYLEKIYNVTVKHVESTLENGKLKRSYGKVGFITKEEDYRRAIVTLPKTESFTFPDICPKEKQEESEKERKEMKEQQANALKKFTDRNSNNPGIPNWFRI